MKKITKVTYINWYKEMLFWRKFEDKLAALYIQQKVRGFLHLYNGQEAVLAGALHAMVTVMRKVPVDRISFKMLTFQCRCKALTIDMLIWLRR